MIINKNGGKKYTKRKIKDKGSDIDNKLV